MGHCPDPLRSLFLILHACYPAPWTVSVTLVPVTLPEGFPFNNGSQEIPLPSGQPVVKEQPVLESKRPAPCLEAGQTLRCNLCSRAPWGPAEAGSPPELKAFAWLFPFLCSFSACSAVSCPSPLINLLHTNSHLQSASGQSKIWKYV